MEVNIKITHFINALLLRVPQIVNFGILGCRQIYFSPKGYLEPQKVEKHCSKTMDYRLRTTALIHPFGISIFSIAPVFFIARDIMHARVTCLENE